MTPGLALAVLATVALMGIQDTAGTSILIAEGRGLRFWPGAMDATGGYANRYGVAAVAGSVGHYGVWSVETFVLVTVACLSAPQGLLNRRLDLMLPKYSRPFRSNNHLGGV
jgi:hypothetical protein